MALATAAKEYWKTRADRLITAKIEQLLANNDPFIRHLRQRARQQALAGLGVADMYMERERLTEQRTQIEAAINTLNGRIMDHLREGAVNIDVAPSRYDYRGSRYENSYINAAAEAHLNELMANHPVGSEILKLEAAKPQISDAIMMANNITTLKQLVSQACERLGIDMASLWEGMG